MADEQKQEQPKQTALAQAQRKQLTPHQRKVEGVRSILTKNIPGLAQALPRHIKPERLVRVVMTAVQNTPKLLDCDSTSFMKAIMQSAQLGLEPDGLLGQAYLVPFAGRVQLIPGYKGLMKLARQSGEIATIDAHEVRVGDKFKVTLGTDPEIRHEPAQPAIKGNEPDPDWRPGAITHFYAAAKLKDGSKQFAVMAKWEVDEIRDKSSGYQYAKGHGGDNPWISSYTEMGKKTAIRRLCKYLPASIELQRAVDLDEMDGAGLTQRFDDAIDVEAIASELTTAASEVAPEDEGKRLPLGNGKNPVVKVEEATEDKKE